MSGENKGGTNKKKKYVATKSKIQGLPQKSKSQMWYVIV